MSDETPYADSVARAGRAAPPGAPRQARGHSSPSPSVPQKSGGPGDESIDDRSPAAVLRGLLDGNRRFHSGAPRHGYDVTQARRHAERPTPAALVIGCVDSRVPPEAVFDQGFGDLLVVRTAGHVLDRAAVASVELAVARMGVPLVVVLGHEACAAVGYAVDAVHRSEHPGGDLGYLVDQISPSVPMDQELSGTQTYDGAVRAHLAAVVEEVRAIPAVARAVAAGEVAVAGVRYSVTYGRAELVVPPS